MTARPLLDAAELRRVLRTLEHRHPRDVVAWALGRFARTRTVVVTSLQLDGMAVVDMALRIDRTVRIVTIDTGRLHEETYAYLDRVRTHYGRPIEVRFPERTAVERFATEHGVNAFHGSVERRLDCCHLRKVEPLQRLLADIDCWLTGLRRDHSERRQNIELVELDAEHGDIVKVNPLAAWTEADTRAYLAEHGVPLHPLYERGYRSIGCAPCTRAVATGEDARAGRWWWEQGIEKECGIHGRPLTREQERRSA